MTALLVTAVPVGTAVFLVIACWLLVRAPRSRPHPMSVRVPAQSGPPDARTSPTPGAAP